MPMPFEPCCDWKRMTLHESSQHRATIIVSITPLKVQADSRTFKQATSVTRFGYTSIVVEGYQSNFDGAALPFQLRTVIRNNHAEVQVAPPQQRAGESATTLPASRHVVWSLWQYCKNKARALKARLPAPAQGAWRLARFVLRAVV